MKDYEDEAFDELEKSLQRKVAHGVTDGSKVTIDRAKLEQVLEALLWANNEINEWREDAYGYDAKDHPQIMLSVVVVKEALEDV